MAAIPVLPLLVLWGRALLSGRWRTPGWLVATAGLCVVAAVGSGLVGALSGASLDPEEACHKIGTSYDKAYRSAHWRESSRWFPLHNRCNAEHDLVPVWVNPVLVLLVVLGATCLGTAVRPAVANRRRARGAG